jgi:large subunit ribosomal protein L3
MAGLIGRKIGMTQIFDNNGLSIPVTVIQAGPCYVVQVKTTEKDGYDAVQLGYGAEKEKNATKPVIGHFAKAGIAVRKYLMEFDFSDTEAPELGAEVNAEIFKPGQEVEISGVSKGKGFQGTVKRHGFGGGSKTHGQSDRLRAPGSLGQGSSPSRVFKGFKMSGRMGGDRRTLKSAEIVRVDAENNLIFVKGPLPGTKNSIIEIRNN